jgi:hypothetical protein
MVVRRWSLRSLAVLVVFVSCGLAYGQDQQLPFEPLHSAGASVTGAFEGWFPNEDGTYSILVGYYSRNLREAVDIPIGPNNRIEPGGPDQGQPTHFLPGRRWDLLTVKVPKDFGTKVLTWTLTTGGVTTTMSLDTKMLWRLSPYVDANGFTPAYMAFSKDGPFVNGPIGQTESLTATVGTPLPLSVWVADPAKPWLLPPAPGAPPRKTVSTEWMMLRGPGTVKFANDKPEVEKTELTSPPAGTTYDGMSTTTATFSVPGQYELNVMARNSSETGEQNGAQCCYTNLKVKVSVGPSPGNTE